MSEKDKTEGEVGGLNIKSTPSSNDNSRTKVVNGNNNSAGNSIPTGSDARTETLRTWTSQNLSERKENGELKSSDSDSAEDWDYDSLSYGKHLPRTKPYLKRMSFIERERVTSRDKFHASAMNAIQQQQGRLRTGSINSLRTLETGGSTSGFSSKPSILCTLHYKAYSRATELAHWYFRKRSIQFFVLLVTIFSCIVYILNTYDRRRSLPVDITQMVFAFIFFVDFVLSMLLQQSKFQYMFRGGAKGLIDLLAVVPSLGVFSDGNLDDTLHNLGFIRFFKLAKHFEVMQVYRFGDPLNETSEVYSQSIILGLKLSGLVIIVTAVIYAVENYNGRDAFTQEMDWHDALYFTVVTLSTVGYGEIAPVHWASRMIMALVITTSFIIVPLEVAKFVETCRALPEHKKGFEFAGRNTHVIIALPPGSGDFDEQVLMRMLGELFHISHNIHNTHLWAILLSDRKPSMGVRNVLNFSEFKLRTLYYQGSLQNPTDLAAVKAEYADAIFVIQPRFNVVERKHILLSAMALQRYILPCPKNLKTLEQVRNISVLGYIHRSILCAPSSEDVAELQMSGVDTVIPNMVLKSGMLAYATLCPAFLPFVASLLRSTNNTANITSSSPGWLIDYADGTTYEIYNVILEIEVPANRAPPSFCKVAQVLYDLTDGNVILIGISDVDEIIAASPIFDNNGGRVPEDFSFVSSAQVFVLAPSRAEAEQAMVELKEELNCNEDHPIFSTHHARYSESRSRGEVLELIFDRSERNNSSAVFSNSEEDAEHSITEIDDVDEITHLYYSQEDSSCVNYEESGWKESRKLIQQANGTLAEALGLDQQDTCTDYESYYHHLQCANTVLAEAMRSHILPPIPEILRNHILVVGYDSPFLAQYICAFRKLHLDVPIVIICKDRSILRSTLHNIEEKIARSNVSEHEKDKHLNIGCMYSVIGDPRQYRTMLDAKCCDAQAVLLLSNQTGSGDDDIILTVFALEQAQRINGSMIRVMVDLKDDKKIFFLRNYPMQILHGTPIPEVIQQRVSLIFGGMVEYVQEPAPLICQQFQAFICSEIYPNVYKRTTVNVVNEQCLIAQAETTASLDFIDLKFFCAGDVWSDSIMDVLAARIYFHPQILNFVQALCAVGDSSQAREPRSSAIIGKTEMLQREGSDISSRPQSLRLLSISRGGSAVRPVPAFSKPCIWGQFKQVKLTGRKFHGKTYGELARFLFRRNCIPLGIYRPAGHKESSLPYTHINPRDKERLLYPGSSQDLNKFIRQCTDIHKFTQALAHASEFHPCLELNSFACRVYYNILKKIPFMYQLRLRMACMCSWKQ